MTPALQLAIRTGDSERLLGQLRDLRAVSLAALGREPDDLQTAEPVKPGPSTAPSAWLAEQVKQMASERREPTAMMPVGPGPSWGRVL